MTNQIDDRMRAAANIVAARRMAQFDQAQISNAAQFRQGIVRTVFGDFMLVWRRMLVDSPKLDALQLADAVEPIKPPELLDPNAGKRAADRGRADENRKRKRSAPECDPKRNAAGLRLARAALRPLPFDDPGAPS